MKRREQGFRRKILFCLILALLIFATGMGMRYYTQSAGTERDRQEEARTYAYHCAYLAEDSEDPFWTSVYEGARKEGKEQNVYVKKFGDSLALDYSVEEKLQMAIASDTDAIIVEGGSAQNLEALIDEAVEKGIVVITVYYDVVGSKRQSFIGINNFQLGYDLCSLAYKYLEKEGDEILVVYDENSENTILSSGMKKFLDEQRSQAVLNARMLSSKETYETQDEIRNLLKDKSKRPRVLVCTSLFQTQCTYQSVVDLNCVGEVKIIGFYLSQTIREAILKDIVQAAMVVDTEQMGRAAVESIAEFLTYGYAEVKSVDINFNGRKVSVDLPSNSLNTFTIQGTPLTGEETDMRQVVPENETVTIQNAASGLVLCIDGDKVSSGAKIIQWAYSDQGNQKWYLESSSVNGVDTVKLVNIKSGSIAAVNGASTAENATVILWPYEGGADQNWILEETEQEGYYKFKNANSGMYLTMNSTDRLTQATQMPESDAQGQLWKVSTVIEQPGTDMLKEFDQSIQASRELLEAYDPEAPVYTQESYEALVQALEAAEQVASNTNPNEGRNDKEAVERAFEELKAAIEGLVCLPSSQEKADLDEAIQRASGLDESKYTAESYTAVKVALEAAQRVDRENRDEVLAATEALSNALAALQEVSKPGDSTEKPGGSTEQPGGSTEQPDNGNQQKPSQTQELPKKNKVYRVGKLYYTVTKSSATAGTVSVKRPVKKNHTSIKIPKTVKINGYTFKVTSIGKKAFYNNRKLKRVTIGSNVTSIGKQAFATAKNLKTVVIKSTKMKSVKKNAFRGIAKKAVINVPNKKAVLRKYKRLLKKSNISSSIKVK